MARPVNARHTSVSLWPLARRRAPRRPRTRQQRVALSFLRSRRAARLRCEAERDPGRERLVEVSKWICPRPRSLAHQLRDQRGTRLYKVSDRYESWFDTRSLASLRYHQQIDEGSYERESKFEIYPDRRVFVDAKGAEHQTSEDPLDDGSFLYFLRTIPLEVGKEYTFERYFRVDRNPVRIKVLRKERVSVPAGTFDAVVVQPIIKTKGIFSENGRAEVWLSDDEHRIMLQMKSRFSRFSLNLFLKSFRLATSVGGAQSAARAVPESLPPNPPE